VQAIVEMFAVVNVGGIVYLLIGLGLLFLNYYAFARIIRQAGYSSTWILLPLAPLAFTLVLVFTSYNDLVGLLHGAPVGLFGFNVLKVVWRLDQFSLFLCWIFYLVFAFSRWPVSRGQTTSGYVRQYPLPPPPAERGTGAQRPVTPSSGPGSRPDRPSRDPGLPAPPTRAVAATPHVSSTHQRTSLFCAWCGESTPGNRALFHNCGDDDRPVRFCKICGKPFAEDASSCADCAA